MASELYYRSLQAGFQVFKLFQQVFLAIGRREGQREKQKRGELHDHTQWKPHDDPRPMNKSNQEGASEF